MDGAIKRGKSNITDKPRSLTILHMLLINLVLLPCLAIPTRAGTIHDSPGLQTDPAITYANQAGTPIGIPNFVLPSAGCNWTGIGGQVFNQDGIPAAGLIVRLSGTIEGQSLSQFAVTGTATRFGPAGFQFTLADHLVASQGAVSIQLMDIAGVPMSRQIALTTFNSCDKNLTLINLVPFLLQNPIYLALLRR